MAQDPLEMFAPKHPHRRLHILVSILAFMAVIGSMAIYQVSRINEGEIMILPPPTLNQDARAAVEREKILVGVQETVKNTAQLTDIERNKIIEDLEKNLNK